MPEKHPKLPNNFKSESEPPENGAKTAHSAPEIAPNDAQSAHSSDALPRGEGARRACPELVEGAGEGSPEDDTRDAAIAAGFIPQVVVGAHGNAPNVEIVSPLRVGSLSSSEDAAERRKGLGEGSTKSKRGPRTPRGKRAVSRNAIKHAILAEHPVAIAGFETIEEWEEFETEVVESWAPAGRYERELATDVAFGLWRLRRCRIHESASLSQQVEHEMKELLAPDDDDWDEGEDEEEGATVAQEPPEPVRIDPARVRTHQQLSIIPDGYKIDRILRYESHVRRCLNQTVHELEAHQARRQGEHPSLARVEFNAGPTLRSPTAAGSSALKEVNNNIEIMRRHLAQQRRRRARSNDD